jgi:RimJ/RimL family protein N-acetyltransferase
MLRGARVWLRQAERDDLPLFVRWLNDAETSSFLSSGAPLSLAGEERWFERLQEKQGEDRWHFVICLLEDSRPIGTIGFFGIDTVDGNAGVGIMIGEKDLWGQGLGTDALDALVDFGFGTLRLERIWLEVYDFNPRARRSYEKCGFVLEGTLRHAVHRRGRFHDVHVMAILRHEWEALPRPRSWDRPSG